MTVNTNPTSDNELPNKKYIDDSIEDTIVRFTETLRKYLKVSVGSDTYNLTKNNKIQLIDVTEVRYPNSGDSLLPERRIKNLNKDNGAKLGFF